MADFSELEGDDWKLLQSRLDANYEVPSDKDASGDTLLHFAIRKQAPSELLTALVHATPQSTSEKNDDWLFPLHLAIAEQAAPELVAVLLQANPQAAAEKDKEGKLPLHLASAHQATPEVVLALLQANPQAAYEKTNKASLALHLASSKQAAVEVVEALLQANPEAASEKTKLGNLPLHLALDNKAPLEVVAALLQANPQAVSEKTKRGNLPLHLALSNQVALEVVTALLQANPQAVSEKTSDESLPLHLGAANQAAPEVVAALIEANPQGAAMKDKHGNLPLHRASAKQAPVELMEVLLEANPQAATERDNDGRRPLHRASASNAATEVVAALLQAYPEAVSETDNEGRLPVHWAVVNQVSVDVVTVLLQANAGAISEGDKDGNLPLHLAAANKQVTKKVVDALLAANPQAILEKDNSGNLPLHRASANQATPEVVEALLQARLQAASEKNADGLLPLHLASRYKASAEVVAALLQANPHAASEMDNGGSLPLHWASATHASIRVVEALLQANPQAAAQRDISGLFPLSMAVREAGESEILRLLALAHPGAVDDRGPAMDQRSPVAEAVHAKRLEQATLLMNLCPPSATLVEELLAPLDDSSTLWHDILIQDMAGQKIVHEVLQRHRGLIDVKDPGERTAYERAPAAMRAVMDDAVQFCGRFKLPDHGRPEHKSATCMVFRAADKKAGDAEVVIKLMRKEDQFRREVAAREGLDSNYVVGVLMTSESEDLAGRWAQDVASRGWGNYQYGLVMEAGDRDLMTVLDKERLDIDQGCQVLKRMAQALKHMHQDAQRIHCDCKPLNVVRAHDGNGGSSWKLIDFDATVPVGGYAGSKSSTGYVPPELLTKSEDGSIHVRAYREVPTGASSAGGQAAVLRDGKYDFLPAHPTFDVWSFGVVAFSVLTASGLFHTNASDNIWGSDLEALYDWSDEHLARRLRDRLPGSHLVASERRDALQDLAEWCLQRDPLQRPQSMLEVLQHAFFEPVNGVRRGEQGIFMSHAQASGSTDVQLLRRQLLKLDPGLDGQCSDGEVRVFMDVCSNLGSWANDQRGLASFLEKALRRRRIFLLFLSEGVLGRPWCQWEIRLALALRKQVVLVLKDEENVDEHIAAASKADEAGVPDWMQESYVSDDHRAAQLSSIFARRGVRYYQSHPALESASVRVIAEAAGISVSQQQPPGHNEEDGDADADHVSCIAVFGDPARLNRLKLFAAEIREELSSAVQVEVNPSASPQAEPFTAVVGFLTAGYVLPQPPATNCGPDGSGLVLVRETDTRAEFGGPSALEQALEGAEQPWREAAARGSIYGSWGAVVPYYSESDFKKVSIRLIAKEIRRCAAASKTPADEDDSATESLEAMMDKARFAVGRACAQLQELEESVAQGSVPGRGGLVQRIRSIPQAAAAAAVATLKAAAVTPPSRPERIQSGRRSRIKVLPARPQTTAGGSPAGRSRGSTGPASVRAEDDYVRKLQSR